MGKGRNIQRKKRKHHFGNQFFNKKPKTDEQNQKKEIDCASSTKIDDLPFIEKNVDKMSYNLIIDISILQNMISAIACCEDCNSRGITIENIGSSRMGFSNKLKLSCSSCAWEKLFFTSKDCKSQLQETIKQGRNSFETNLLGINFGRETNNGTMKRNSKRIDHSRRKSSELGKQRRKKLRTIKKGFADKEKELEEVECYVPGGF